MSKWALGSLSALLFSLRELRYVTLANKLKHFQFKYVSFNIVLILLFKFDAKPVSSAAKKKNIAKKQQHCCKVNLKEYFIQLYI